jgi:dTDP-4-dehydrorhamnose reductase
VKWLILGAGGQLGSALVRLLETTESKQDIKAFDHRQADITNAMQIEEIVKSFKPDQIVNAAAWTDVAGAESNIDLANKVNAQGAINVAIAAKITGASLLHISTDYVFDGDFALPISEGTQINPLNKYGESKANAEILLTEGFRSSVVILRTAWLYGPKGKNFARTVIAKAIKNKDEEISVVDDQWGQPTSTLDLAQKILELGNRRIKTGIFHGTNAGQTNWYEFAKYLLESAELDSTVIKPVNSSQFPTQVVRPRYSVLSHEGWKDIGIMPMRDWRLPARELAKVIREEVENGV